MPALGWQFGADGSARPPLPRPDHEQRPGWVVGQVPPVGRPGLLLDQQRRHRADRERDLLPHQARLRLWRRRELPARTGHGRGLHRRGLGRQAAAPHALADRLEHARHARRHPGRAGGALLYPHPVPPRAGRASLPLADLDADRSVPAAVRRALADHRGLPVRRPERPRAAVRAGRLEHHVVLGPGRGALGDGPAGQGPRPGAHGHPRRRALGVDPAPGAHGARAGPPPSGRARAAPAGVRACWRPSACSCRPATWCSRPSRPICRRL